MNKSLITTNQSAKVALSRSKRLLDTTNKILKNKDNEWMQRLWKWFNLNNNSIVNFPNKREDLLKIDFLQIEFCKDNTLGYLPNEIGMLKQLEALYLHDIVELPNTIINLKNLKYLTILWYYCEEQGNNTELISKWISELKLNGCRVFIDCDIH